MVSGKNMNVLATPKIVGRILRGTDRPTTPSRTPAAISQHSRNRTLLDSRTAWATDAWAVRNFTHPRGQDG